MIRTSIRAALFIAMSAAALGAAAQGSAELRHAQERYHRQIAHCNSGKLPAPEREACVRRAGAALDKARGGPPATTTMRSADGRSTVVVPQGAPTPPGSSARRSSDGRSTVIQPNDPAGGQPARQP